LEIDLSAEIHQNILLPSYFYAVYIMIANSLLLCYSDFANNNYVKGSNNLNTISTVSISNNTLADLNRKRDEKKIMTIYKNLDLDKVIKLQRKWRDFKVRQIMDTKNEEKIKDNIKQNILSQIQSNETLKKISSMMFNCLNLYESLLKNNKSK
jgi:hypothetical protein